MARRPALDAQGIDQIFQQTVATLSRAGTRFMVLQKRHRRNMSGYRFNMKRSAGRQLPASSSR